MKTVYARYVPAHFSETSYCEVSGAWVFRTPNGFLHGEATRDETTRLARDEFGLCVKFDGEGPN